MITKPILLSFIGLLLCISSAQSNTVADVQNRLHGTQWTGKAGIPKKSGGLSWVNIPAHMSFEVKEDDFFTFQKYWEFWTLV